MKTIKVIELLNMLANEEYDKLPEKLEFKNGIYEFDDRFGEYVYPINAGEIIMFLFERIFSNNDINKNLNHELVIIEEPILDEKEKEYLSAVVKPFRDKVCYIKKISDDDVEYIFIMFKNFKDNDIYFPFFRKGTMYKGMEPDKKYKLEELGL